MNSNNQAANVVLTVHVRDGTGTFYFPQQLKHALLNTFIRCHAMECVNPDGKTYFMYSNVSTYQERDDIYKDNLLRMFTASKNTLEFPTDINNTLSMTPDRMSIHIKEWKNNKLQIASHFQGTAVIELFGFRDYK